MTNVHEIWMDIPNYEGFYKVSNSGRIMSHDMSVKCRANSYRTVKGRERKISILKNGYAYVALYKNTNFEQLYLHRIVAITFLEKPANKDFVNHKDGNKLNNTVDNLEWVNACENMAHASKNNLLNPPKGERNGHNVLTQDEAREIKTLTKTMSTEGVRLKLGFSKEQRHLIANIKCGRIWKDI